LFNSEGEAHAGTDKAGYVAAENNVTKGINQRANNDKILTTVNAVARA
jgi:hypothetical protein